jgi:hypothetical protein
MLILTEGVGSFCLEGPATAGRRQVVREQLDTSKFEGGAYCCTRLMQARLNPGIPTQIVHQLHVLYSCTLYLSTSILCIILIELHAY